MTTTASSVDNGVDIEFLRGARELLTEQPAVAQFKWRVSNTWVKGTHSRTTALSYYGLGEEQNHRTEFVFEGDHPETFMSEDNGATPTEIVLAALAGCLTAGVASVATQRDIQLRSVTANLEADMDVRGVMGVDNDVRNGFSAIRVSYSIDADATPAEIRAVVAQSQKRSAVFDIITNPTNVSVEVS